MKNVSWANGSCFKILSANVNNLANSARNFSKFIWHGSSYTPIQYIHGVKPATTYPERSPMYSSRNGSVANLSNQKVVINQQAIMGKLWTNQPSHEWHYGATPPRPLGIISSVTMWLNWCMVHRTSKQLIASSTITQRFIEYFYNNSNRGLTSAIQPGTIYKATKRAQACTVNTVTAGKAQRTEVTGD